MYSQDDMFELLLNRIEILASDKGRMQERLNELEDEYAEYKLQQPNKSLETMLEQAVPLLVAALNAPRDRIRMIKALREMTGCSLKEGKEAVEKAIDDKWYVR